MNDIESADLRFKRLTIENWMQPDPLLSIFVRYSWDDGTIRKLSGEDWAVEILAVELSDRVPLEVQRLFAVARGALIYGHFFYPLYTLGIEQLFRVADAAVMHKCQSLGISTKLDFKKRLDRLINAGAISRDDEARWDALRNLRNLTSHPEDQSILPPGVAIEELRGIAADIEGLFTDV